jgi:hypothetical protein
VIKVDTEAAKRQFSYDDYNAHWQYIAVTLRCKVRLIDDLKGTIELD